jgi:DNA-binding transcriptional ArsR family regulator
MNARPTDGRIKRAVPRSTGHRTSAREAELEALLGAQRARVLRLLDRPRSAGAVAKALMASPGAATHHVRKLEAAGLIARERVGRNVAVHRTPRGTALLMLYGAHPRSAGTRP